VAIVAAFVIILTGVPSGGTTVVSTRAQLAGFLTSASRTQTLPAPLDLSLSQVVIDDFGYSGGSGFGSSAPDRGCMVDFRATTATGSRPNDTTCTYGEKSAKRLVILYGDSHAAMWLPALAKIGQQQHFRVLLLSRASCFVADMSLWVWSSNSPSAACDQWKIWATNRIASLRPQVVVVSDDANGYQRDAKYQLVPPSTYAAAQTAALKKLGAPGRKIIVIGRTPSLPGPVPACLAANATSIGRCGITVKKYTSTISAVEALSATRAGATFVSPRPWLCTATFCPPVVGHTVVYSDDGHVARSYAAEISTVVGNDLHAAGL
jgi:hypothetical protein